MQTGLTVCKTSLHFLIVFSWEHILLGKEAHDCPIFKCLCASPFNSGTGNTGNNIPSSITCWLSPSTAQRRNTQTTIITWKKYFSSFLTQTYLTNFWQCLEQILLLHLLCRGHYTTDQEIWRKAELTTRHHSHILFCIKQGTYLAYSSPSHPAITASIWHSAEFPQESLYFSELKHWILRIQWRTTQLSQPSKGWTDGICYFASTTVSLDITFTYFTGKLTRYLNAYLDIKQFPLLGQMHRTVKTQGVQTSQ